MRYGLGKRGNPAGAYGKGRWLKWPKPAWPLTETCRRGRAGRLHREAAASVPAGGRSEPRRPAPAAALPLPAGRTWQRPRRRGGFAGGRAGKGREGTGRNGKERPGRRRPRERLRARPELRRENGLCRRVPEGAERNGPRERVWLLSPCSGKVRARFWPQFLLFFPFNCQKT